MNPDQPTGPIEMFLLAAISRGGLNTLYALRSEVGLQPGSLAGVIKTLVQSGLLTRTVGMKRGRRTMALTELGEEFLAENWRKGLNPRREIESVLRSAILALLMDDLGSSISFLFAAASERDRQASPLKSTTRPRSPVEVHRSWRADFENRRGDLEASLLREFAERLDAQARSGQFAPFGARRTEHP